MAFRKLKAKKYNGILEYYNSNSKDKEVKSLYVTVRNELGISTKIKLDTLDLDDAKVKLAAIKNNILIKKEKVKSGEIKVNHLIRNKKLTLDDLARLYFDSRDTISNHADEIKYKNRIQPHLGRKLLSQIRADDILKMQKDLKLKYAPKSINDGISILRAMFTTGMKSKNNWCSINPLDNEDIKKLKVDPTTGRVLSDDELELLFRTVKDGSYDLGLPSNPFVHVFLKCAYYTGGRPAGILDIKYQDLDFNENKIKLKAMKLSDAYVVTVKDELMEFFKCWIKDFDLQYNDFIFFPQQLYAKTNEENLKQRAIHYDGMRKMAKPYFEKLFNNNIPTNDSMNRISFYSLRRTSGTKIYKAKGIFHAMVFLNHTSVKTTQKYLNIRSDLGDITDVL